mmetsp:Transcript_17547/g.16891  ORF Transcript_17547/g.16891 Transcript_17547/m.16891 type:complete len:86 (-) Transcript_17547:851-1108(-)
MPPLPPDLASSRVTTKDDAIAIGTPRRSRRGPALMHAEANRKKQEYEAGIKMVAKIISNCACTNPVVKYTQQKIITKMSICEIRR